MIHLHHLRRQAMRFVFISICLADFQLAQNSPTLGSPNNPRLLSKDIISGVFEYQVHQNHSVFFYDSDEMYVGGTDFVLKLDGDHFHIIKKFPLQTLEQQQCQEGRCKYVITVIEKFQDSLFVCGTNGHKPQCWKLSSSAKNQSHDLVEAYEGTGISPFVYTHNSVSLTAEGDLYSAAPLDTDGSSLQFRRKAGSRTNVWMYDNWVSEPTFISASWVKRREDPDNEKIYMFFRENNSDRNPEADPWISRVARVCKVDEGGSKRFFQNMWTSFLKARLVCGFPEESLYFNRLQDIYVMHAEDWHNTRVYALFTLFTNSWNSTAVCVYSIGMIEEIFDNSSFKGYNKEIPKPRPGTCVKNSKNLAPDTINLVKDHPEMTDWVHSMHYTAPFYISSNNYTKIAVDRVQAADGRMYNVLLLATGMFGCGGHALLLVFRTLLSYEYLVCFPVDVAPNHALSAISTMNNGLKIQYDSKNNVTTICCLCAVPTDSGKIHKVLESGSKPFLISETQLSSNSTIQSMKLDFKKKKLVVGFSEKIYILDLQRCQEYNKSCADCVLARDPYCAWTEFGCTPTVHDGIQNIINGNKSVCPKSAEEQTQVNRSRRETASQSPVDLTTAHSVPLGVPFYLSCPIDSYHAVYTWEHADRNSPCLQMQSNCLHLIPRMTQENYGGYKCVSKEKDYTKVVIAYHLTEQIIPDTKDNTYEINLKTNAASAAVPQTVRITLGLAVLAIFR